MLVIIVYSPVGAFSGIVICVSVELFWPMLICSVLLAMFWFLWIAVWLIVAFVCLVVGLVSVVMKVIFPPGTTVLTSGVVVIVISFGDGVSSFMLIIVAIMSITIITAIMVMTLVFITRFPVVSAIAALISRSEYPDCFSLARIAFGEYP